MHAVTQAVEAWDYSQPFDNVASDDMRWMRDEYAIRSTATIRGRRMG